LDCYFFLEAKGSDSPHATKMREAMEQANRFRNPSEGQKNWFKGLRDAAL